MQKLWEAVNDLSELNESKWRIEKNFKNINWYSEICFSTNLKSKNWNDELIAF